MKCENCGSNITVRYGSGRFCCEKCARSFSSSNNRLERNKKISYTLTKNKDSWKYKQKEKNIYCINCFKKLKKGQALFCCHPCHNQYEYLLYINRWQLNMESGMSGRTNLSLRIKKYLLWKNGNKCQKCGWDKISKYSGNCPVHVHHIDGNVMNNKEDNLELLCPNCHSLTNNFGSLNIGKSKRVFYTNGTNKK
jgi:hypothetical protein